VSSSNPGSLICRTQLTGHSSSIGSGTTLAAAELTERVCLGMELDPKYVDCVVQRWQTLAGKKATLDGDGRTFDEIAEERRKEAA
jgi:DNA modification methylase